MSRKKKFFLNSSAGFLKQVITLICGFLLPRYMLLYYGSAVNGLVSSITHFLGFISLLEMGIGPVIQANLYKPLADNDTLKISQIVISAEKFFKRIAFIFIAYITVLVIGFPTFINGEYDFLFTGSLILIISVSTFAQYYFGITYQLLLNAAQKSYVQLYLQIATVVFNTLLSIILIKLGASIQVVKLVSTILFLLRPLCQMWYVNKYFRIDKKIKFKGEPIKQKWNGFAQHLAGAVCSGTDIFVLTVFAPLAIVSVYNVYYSIVIGVSNLIIMLATGMESLFGDMIARNEKKEIENSFEIVEKTTHFIVTVVFTIALITIVPFVIVYTRGITDANYEVPLFSALLVTAYAIQSIRVPYARIVNAAGKFKETQVGALISAGINIVLTVALVFKWGLVGTAIGTLVAMLYHTIYYAQYLTRDILSRPLSKFLYCILVDAIIVGLSYLLTRKFILVNITYGGWIFLALKVSIVTIIVASIITAIMHRSFVKKIIARIKERKVKI